jgi:hypothetical protein
LSCRNCQIDCFQCLNIEFLSNSDIRQVDLSPFWCSSITELCWTIRDKHSPFLVPGSHHSNIIGILQLFSTWNIVIQKFHIFISNDNLYSLQSDT